MRLLILFEMKRKSAIEAGETSIGTSSMATVKQIPSQASPMRYAGMRLRKAHGMG